MSQLALPLQLADHAVFASFQSDGNEPLVATLREIAAGKDAHGCWLWGKPASGKTHLLQAVCEEAGDRATYLPFRLLADAGPEVLDGLTTRDIVCLDDIERVLGDTAYELALFDLCNQASDAGVQLIVAANASPRESAIELADLASRFTRLPVFQVHTLDEDALHSALKLRSGHRGLDLPDETAAYLLKRSRRDMASLYEVLDRLDKEALAAKRRLTVPFVRGVLESS